MGGPLRGSGAPPSFAVDPSPRKEGKKTNVGLDVQSSK